MIARGFVATVTVAICVVAAAAPQLPQRLTDGEFWALVEALSEPDRPFVSGEMQFSDNLVSNELGMPDVVSEIADAISGAYLGVGPEQNFSYIAALRPPIAFIVDIRRGNRDLHLMYKALFELAADRAQFVSLLFGRPRPRGLRPESTAAELFEAYGRVEPSQALHEPNVAAVRTHLLRTRSLPLSDDEVEEIARIQTAFFTFGPEIHYWSGASEHRHPGLPSYLALMTDIGPAGPQSFLSSEPRFRVVQDLHRRNLIVPVVGDFAGRTAVRALGRWLANRDARVSVFYLSNVDAFLQRAGKWDDFCANARALPLISQSLFVRVDPKPDARGRSLESYGWDRDGDRVSVAWSDGIRETMSEQDFRRVHRLISGFETGSLLELARTCRPTVRIGGAGG